MTSRESFSGGDGGFERRRAGCGSALAALVLGVGILGALAAGPLHAQCAVRWKIGLPCFDVSSLLVNQIKEWSTQSCPGTSQRCFYALVSVSSDDISATHSTPVMRFVDDVTFNFSSSDPESCDVQGVTAIEAFSQSEISAMPRSRLCIGLSVSRSWYAVLDWGTNYLNMYNLMRGSGLSSSPLFTESTSEQLCTQLSSARQKLPPSLALDHLILD
ncbi:hypothetical protein DNTS_016933 [Danionella cerebrum]|uniref:Uncharacterized protein n=1 Tax=Danionella cerebrum TaxID=2873325 RepID=A0A553QG00_9TELE|nr:hypothetical protein DNTS_016933 [Danionella translucida]